MYKRTQIKKKGAYRGHNRIILDRFLKRALTPDRFLIVGIE